jgi:hypothetical protein
MIAEIITVALLLFLFLTIMLSHINQPKPPPYRIIETTNKIVGTDEITSTHFKIERHWMDGHYLPDFVSVSTLKQAQAYIEAMTEESK